MSKIMLINVTHPEETRVGIIEDGVLASFEIESLSREHLKGNIYKGVVQRIHPALEAAFVDIGGTRHAFLPLDEVCFQNLPERKQSEEGSGSTGHRRRRIRDLLRSGQELLVQIAREPYGTKPPTLSTFFSLPGRYLVLLPGTDDSGISRRIEGEERVRLRAVLDQLKRPDGMGIIVRTAAGFDNHLAEFERDLAYLTRVWDNVQRAAEANPAPTLLYREHDIVLRTIRDFYTPDVDEIHIDNEDVFVRARNFLRDVMPGHEKVLRLYKGARPIFSAFNVEVQFESIFKRKVALPTGGGIVIDATEALTAIDVNSGGSMRGANPEETAFRTNMQAAAEICRQLRLRDIGGIIVVDFIDMRESAHNREVEQAMRDGLRTDKARHDVGHISRLGLMEVSRQRLRPTAMTTTYTTCPMCDGHGAVRTHESASLVALRKIHNRAAQGDAGELRVSAPSAVALYLLNRKREAISRLESRYGLTVRVVPKAGLLPHEIELEVRPRKPEPEQAALLAPGSVADPVGNGEPETPAAGEESTASAENGNGKKRRRRRGRRRGRGGLKAAIAIGDALASLGAMVSKRTEGGSEDDAGMVKAPETTTEAPAAPITPGIDARPEEEKSGPPAEAASDASEPKRQRTRRRRSASGGRGRRTTRKPTGNGEEASAPESAPAEAAPDSPGAEAAHERVAKPPVSQPRRGRKSVSPDVREAAPDEAKAPARRAPTRRAERSSSKAKKTDDGQTSSRRAARTKSTTPTARKRTAAASEKAAAEVKPAASRKTATTSRAKTAPKRAAATKSKKSPTPRRRTTKATASAGGPGNPPADPAGP